jgi:hypothetical protein
MFPYQDINMLIAHRSSLVVVLLSAGFFFALCFLPSSAFASTNISSVANQHWAWNDLIGWINFYSTGNVTINASQLTGYATSSAGPISVDCATSPSGNICAPANGNYKVVNCATPAGSSACTANGNLASGVLVGWAWNDLIGWISFNCNNNNWCSTSTYGVYIDSSGNFHGYAWSDSIGWISFNCLDIGGSFCTNTSNYEVAGGWAPVAATGILDSPTLDTGLASGAELNSILWLGSLDGLPSSSVAFQIAVSNSTSSSWLFQGPDGTASSSYSGSPGVPIPLTNYAAYVGYRYFRYRVILTTDASQSLSPQVTSVSVDWSP